MGLAIDLRRQKKESVNLKKDQETVSNQNNREEKHGRKI